MSRRPSKQIGMHSDATELMAAPLKEPQSYTPTDGVEEIYFDPQAHVTQKDKKNVYRVIATQSIPVRLKRPLSEEEKKYRDYMWEYVEGVYENRFSNGEAFRFWMNPFPGDDYSEFYVPANVPVSMPRWMAKHLNTRKWVQFKEKPKPENELAPLGYMDRLVPDKIHHRTSFMKLNEY